MSKRKRNRKNRQTIPIKALPKIPCPYCKEAGRPGTLVLAVFRRITQKHDIFHLGGLPSIVNDLEGLRWSEKRFRFINCTDCDLAEKVPDDANWEKEITPYVELLKSVGLDLRTDSANKLPVQKSKERKKDFHLFLMRRVRSDHKQTVPVATTAL